MVCLDRQYKKIIGIIVLFLFFESCQFKEDSGIKINLYSGEIFCENSEEKIEWITISSNCSTDLEVLLIFGGDSIRNKINYKEELLMKGINPDSLFSDCSKYGFSIHTITEGSSPVPYEINFEINQFEIDSLIRFDYMRM